MQHFHQSAIGAQRGCARSHPEVIIGVCSPAVAYLGSQQAAPPRLGRQSMRVSPCGASRRRRLLGCAALRHRAGRRSRRSTVVTKPTRVALPAAPGKGSASGLRPPLPVSAVLAPGALLALPALSTRAAIPAATRSGPLTTPARSPPGSAKGLRPSGVVWGAAVPHRGAAL